MSHLLDNVKDENDKLSWELFRLRRCLYKTYEKELMKYGITPEQEGVLKVIKIKGSSATYYDITTALCRETHTISMLTARMQNKGLVKVAKNGKGKSRVSLTKTGEKILEGIHDVHKESQGIFNILTVEERQFLESIFGRLIHESLNILRSYRCHPY